MRNGVALVALAGAGLVNGLWLDVMPVWRQLLFVVLAVVAYLHGRHLPMRRGGVVVAAAVAVGVVIGAARFWEGVGALASLGLVVVLPRLAGLFRRQQAELVEAGRERIVQLERAQELVAEQARWRERARIAADVHDSLGHELALIALRAGALELTGSTESDRRAAAELRESAVTATDRLRRTIGVLRRTAPVEPPDETVEALVERASAAGLPVTLVRVGPTTPLPAPADRAVHRVVREALTNAARHAPGAPVSVRVERTPDEVAVTVSNPTASTPTASTPPDADADADAETDTGTGTGRSGGAAGSRGGGNGAGARCVGGGGIGGCGYGSTTGDDRGGAGLVGLAERVGLSGGTLRSGPKGGRFTVLARLPVRSDVEGRA